MGHSVKTCSGSFSVPVRLEFGPSERRWDVHGVAPRLVFSYPNLKCSSSETILHGLHVEKESGCTYFYWFLDRIAWITRGAVQKIELCQNQLWLWGLRNVTGLLWSTWIQYFYFSPFIGDHVGIWRLCWFLPIPPFWIPASAGRHTLANMAETCWLSLNPHLCPLAACLWAVGMCHFTVIMFSLTQSDRAASTPAFPFPPQFGGDDRLPSQGCINPLPPPTPPLILSFLLIFKPVCFSHFSLVRRHVEGLSTDMALVRRRWMLFAADVNMRACYQSALLWPLTPPHCNAWSVNVAVWLSEALRGCASATITCLTAVGVNELVSMFGLMSLHYSVLVPFLPLSLFPYEHAIRGTCPRGMQISPFSTEEKSGRKSIK